LLACKSSSLGELSLGKIFLSAGFLQARNLFAKRKCLKSIFVDLEKKLFLNTAKQKVISTFCIFELLAMNLKALIKSQYSLYRIVSSYG